MTPFGAKLRQMRAGRDIKLKDMAKALDVTPAYLSALEHGHRARPKAGFVQQVAAYFNLAWDEVDDLKALADLSDPKVTIETGGLTPLATELANRLAKRIADLDADALTELNEQLKPKVG